MFAKRLLGFTHVQRLALSNRLATVLWRLLGSFYIAVILYAAVFVSSLQFFTTNGLGRYVSKRLASLEIHWIVRRSSLHLARVVNDDASFSFYKSTLCVGDRAFEIIVCMLRLKKIIIFLRFFSPFFSFAFFFLFLQCLITSHEIGAQFTFSVDSCINFLTFREIWISKKHKSNEGKIIEDDNANFLRQDLGRMRD